jgi:hypothetical protein
MGIDIQQLGNQYGLSETQFKDIKGVYDQLSAEKKATFSETDFQALLRNQGWQVQFLYGNKDLPVLSPPGITGTFSLDKLDLTGGGMASPGAAILALLTKDAAEQRRVNKELIYQQSEEIVADIKSQAKDIRSKAIVQLVIGVCAGALSIAGGAISSCKAGSALSSYKAGTIDSAQLSTMGTQIQAQQGAWSAGGGLMNTASQFAGSMYDAAMKETDAEIEKTRSAMDSLKAFNDSLTELIQKSQNTFSEIQANMNQTRAKILG